MTCVLCVLHDRLEWAFRIWGELGSVDEKVLLSNPQVVECAAICVFGSVLVNGQR